MPAEERNGWQAPVDGSRCWECGGQHFSSECLHKEKGGGAEKVFALSGLVELCPSVAGLLAVLPAGVEHMDPAHKDSRIMTGRHRTVIMNPRRTTDVIRF